MIYSHLIYLNNSIFEVEMEPFKTSLLLLIYPFLLGTRSIEND